MEDLYFSFRNRQLVLFGLGKHCDENVDVQGYVPWFETLFIGLENDQLMSICVIEFWIAYEGEGHFFALYLPQHEFGYIPDLIEE